MKALPEARRQRAAKKNRQSNVAESVVSGPHDLPGMQRNQLRLWRNVWFIVAASLMLLGAWGLFAWYFALPGAGYIRSDPFGLDKEPALTKPIEFLFSAIPNPELARIPVLPGGLFGALSMRPMPSAFVNSPSQVWLTSGASGEQVSTGKESQANEVTATQSQRPATTPGDSKQQIKSTATQLLAGLALVQWQMELPRNEVMETGQLIVLDIQGQAFEADAATTDPEWQPLRPNSKVLHIIRIQDGAVSESEDGRNWQAVTQDTKGPQTPTTQGSGFVVGYNLNSVNTTWSYFSTKVGGENVFFLAEFLGKSLGGNLNFDLLDEPGDSLRERPFYSMTFAPDVGGVESIWAGSDEGTVFELRSPIKTRKDTIPHRLPTSVPIRSIVFATPPEATTAFGWAASGWNDGNEERTERPVILETRDGGKTWEWLKYRWLPAPWVYVALLLAIGAFWRGTAAHVELSRQKEKPGIAEHGVSDDPIGLSDPDALGLAPIARAMSRFLRNVQTEPSLAVGVTGPWGSGKSSLMNLVRQDLEDRGVRSVWFNAWHHQREESLLAALLMTIRAQAVPPIWSWSGWRVRFYRLWSRATVNPLGTVAVLVVLVGLAVLLGWLTKIYGKELLKWWFTSGEHSWAGFAGKIGLSTTAIALVGGLWQLFKPFSTTPAKLLATLQGRSNNKDLELQLTFRYRFAREFSAFCAALRHPPNPGLVIFVDDLDRCGSRQTVDVLESLNFVTTAGKCFVIGLRGGEG